MDFLGITIGAAVTYLLVRYVRKTRAYERFWLEKAEIAFKESSIRSSSVNLSFSGLDAKIIDEKKRLKQRMAPSLHFKSHESPLTLKVSTFGSFLDPIVRRS